LTFCNFSNHKRLVPALRFTSLLTVLNFPIFGIGHNKTKVDNNNTRYYEEEKDLK